MVRRYNLVEVEGDGVASLCEFDLCGIWCLCQIGPSRGTLGGFIYAAS
jgi:hypothetical protein